MEREVVITGIGPILPSCDHVDIFWDHIKSGNSQLDLMSDPSLPGKVIPAGCIRNFDPAKYLSTIPERYVSSYSPLLQHYLASLFLAREDAGLDLSLLSPDRIAIYDGSSRGTIAFWDKKIKMEADLPPSDVYSRKDIISGVNGVTTGVAAALLNIYGPTISFSGSCCSGLFATGQAFRDISSGVVDAAFATGYDEALTASLFASYREAGIISQESEYAQQASKPYDNEPSLVFGEGAVTLMLEEHEFAQRRGANILAKITSYTQGNEGYNPYRSGGNIERSVHLLQSLFKSTNLHPEQTDFFVGHGNGVPQSDIAEINVVKQFFGKMVADIALISVKPIYGHIIGGSSSVNIAAAALMLHNNYLVPTVNAGCLLSQISKDYDNKGKHKPDCSQGVAFSWGMGGNIAAMLLEKI